MNFRYDGACDDRGGGGADGDGGGGDGGDGGDGSDGAESWICSFQNIKYALNFRPDMHDDRGGDGVVVLAWW